MLVSLKLNVMDQGFELKAQQGVDTQTTPARMDAATGVWADAPPNEFGIGKDLRSVSATVGYYSDVWSRSARFQVRVRYQPIPRFR